MSSTAGSKHAVSDVAPISVVVKPLGHAMQKEPFELKKPWGHGMQAYND